MARPQSILFVCHGNQVRSPLAAVLFKGMVARDPELSQAKLDIDSAGISGSGGHPATRLARDVAKARGLSLENHRAKQIYEDTVKYYDLVLAMTAKDKQDLLAKFPFARGKVFTLNEYAGSKCEVSDPQWTSSPEAYEETAREIEQLLEAVVKKLKAS
ncbi:MAG: low molecular weight protein arginine phosphatase [Chloroflexi bacterium]|nr:low molecular weight protein arginine phosphatase [Chloroflexota bacterium]